MSCEVIITKVNCTLPGVSDRQIPTENCLSWWEGGERGACMHVCLCCGWGAGRLSNLFKNSDSLCKEDNYLYFPFVPQRMPQNSKLSVIQPLIRGYKNTAETAAEAVRERSPVCWHPPERTLHSARGDAIPRFSPLIRKCQYVQYEKQTLLSFGSPVAWTVLYSLSLNWSFNVC